MIKNKTRYEIGLDDEYTCPVCGKLFYVPNPVTYAYKWFYGYKGSWKPVCSWHCLQEVRHKKEERYENLAKDENGRYVYTFNGETKTLVEWSKITGIHYSILLVRYKDGLPNIFKRRDEQDDK